MAKRKYQIEFGTIQVDAYYRLLSEMDVSRSKTRQWFRGEIRPQRKQALRLFQYIDLPLLTLNNNLKEWGYSRLTRSEYATIKNSTRPIIVRESEKDTRIVSTSRDMVETARASQEINQQITSLEEKFNSISDRFEKVLKTSKKKAGSDLIMGEMEELKQKFDELQDTSQRLAAPIVLPEPEDMQVTLVSSSSLERLEEYRSEENKWYSVLTLFIGSILGVLINLATGGTLTPTAGVIITVFVIMGVFAGWSALDFQRRAKNTRTKMLPNKMKEVKNGDSNLEQERFWEYFITEEQSDE